MDNLSELYLAWKKRVKGTHERLSEESGVPIATVRRAVNPNSKTNTTMDTYSAIHKVLTSGAPMAGDASPGTNVVQEEAYAYGRDSKISPTPLGLEIHRLMRELMGEKRDFFCVPDLNAQPEDDLLYCDAPEYTAERFRDLLVMMKELSEKGHSDEVDKLAQLLRFSLGHIDNALQKLRDQYILLMEVEEHVEAM